MVGAWLVSLMTLIMATSSDAAALVARLGSATVAEREEAAKALEAMGRGAVPALEAALRSPDAEVRARVLSAWERVQKRLLVQPSMVRLEGKGRPLADVVRSIGEQAGFSIEISPHVPERPVHVHEPLPIPFWQAIDQLGLVGGQFTKTNPRGPVATLAFGFGGNEIAYPSTVSGPFRITLKALHDHRDRLLTGGPWLRIDTASQRFPIPRNAKEREARFYIDLGMTIEPRMWFTQEGPARAIEALDDLGQSLVRRDTTKVEEDHSLFYSGGGAIEGWAQLDLTMPDKPGRSIARLQGSVPVAIQIRKPVPALEIPLTAAPGTEFTHEDAVFTLREIHENDHGTLIGVDVRINLDRFELPAGHDGENVTSRLRCLTDHQLEIVDADGNVLTQGGGAGSTSGANARTTLSVSKNRHQARPARLRYYQMFRAFTDVAFEFQMIPMP